MLDKVKKFITDPQIRLGYLSKLGVYDNMPDEKYLKKCFRIYMQRDLDLENPKTFNEKLQWLKLYNRNPEYTVMVDKVKVKEWVAEKVGKEYIIPTLGVWDDPDEIDFKVLPDQFVLKCNHNSGTGMCICKDKSKLDIDKVKKELKKGLNEDYYLKFREWPYKNVPRKILAEAYLNDNDKEELNDYKLMCFNGKLKMTFVCTDRFSDDGLKVTFYDREWRKMPFERHYHASKVEIEKPHTYDKMIQLAERLSNGIPFVRVDFYEVKGKVYFGEMTFFPGSGFEEFTPENWDYDLGDMLLLPEKVIDRVGN